MSQTKIEWCDKVWNPITGCSPVSEGCRNCYAKRMAYRLKGRYGYPKDEPFKVTFHPDRLNEPLHWKKPCRIFVCSMGDLFHEDVEGEWLKDIFSIIRACSNHTFLLLTKRPQNVNKRYFEYFGLTSYSHVYLGVSVEDQPTADERIPILLQIPAAHRWVSIEPMLGPVDLDKWISVYKIREDDLFECKVCGWVNYERSQPFYKCLHTGKTIGGIDWVVLGGETGPHARPLHPDWVISIKDQGVTADVPFFFKGWGDHKRKNAKCPCGCRKWKTKDRLLDGKIWEEYP